MSSRSLAELRILLASGEEGSFGAVSRQGAEMWIAVSGPGGRRGWATVKDLYAAEALVPAPE